jgi:hypothetical protein
LDELFDKIRVKVKGEALPVRAGRGPEGCRRVRILDFKTLDT